MSTSPTTPIGITILHRSNLREQTYDSRIRNIQAELLRQLDMQFGLDVSPEDRLAEHLLRVDDRERLSLILCRHFPFLLSPMTLIEKSATFADLITAIADQVGA